MSFPFAFWKSAAINPASLALSAWHRANAATGYTMAAGTGTFLAVASAGSSGTNGSLTNSTSPPAVGAALNGHNPPDFNGTSNLLQSPNDFSSYVTGAAGTVIVLFRADTAAAASGNRYDDPALVCDDVNAFSLNFSSGGVGVAYYDAAWKGQRVACTTNAWHAAKCRWNGTNCEIGVDSAAFTSFAAGPLALAATYKLTVGRVQISSQAFFDGRIAEVMIASTRLSDANVANIISYFNARYGLAL